MPSKPTPFKYNIGDRVAERPKVHLSCATTPQGIAKSKQLTFQRYGTVVNLSIKKDSRGAKRKFIDVRWDHNQSISTHEQMRLCFISDLKKLTEEMRNIIGD